MLKLLRHGLGKGFVVPFLLLMAVSSVCATEIKGTDRESAIDSSVITLENTEQQGALPDRVTPVSELESNQSGTLEGQVTSVSQLTDVQPTDWAFGALQSLVERYGCIEGYPDRTYRGNRAITRYEFAAGLNACLNRIQELIASATPDSVRKEDLEALRRLQEDFAAELATLRGRVDGLEARTARLESQQFSTTTKLSGYVVFALVNVFGDQKAVGSGAGILPATPGDFGVPNSPRPSGSDREDVDDNLIFTDRIRLILTSSFTGKDKLIMRLQAGNTPSLDEATGTAMSRLAFSSPSDNRVSINQLEYRFPLGDRGTFFVEAFGFLDLFVPTLHPLDGDYDTVLTGFALRSPIYFPSGVTGAGFNYNITKAINIGGGYLAGNPTANDPTSGLFNGPYGALAQITVKPLNKFAVALTYLHAYDDGSGNAPPGGFFGSQNSTFPFGPFPSSTNGYGIEAQYSFSPRFIVSGWYYFAKAKAEAGFGKGADATIQAWAGALAFPDLFKEGNLGGIVVGMPSKVTENDVRGFEDRDTSIMVDAFYKFQVTDNIGITPGIVVITNPEHNSSNDTIFVGMIRTNFNF
ncbi:iron uptake porin [Argonema antarcticum]|uniref:iron uptake porin n=1 Tax=Argonema antarcticum TaxID=2942763 RepID=UPI002013A992|nr:iron uptake porin [Argonema antarcticum]MCL1472219.1 iron uptake porin [Argonema antarcticum A004/B2]